jgi:hypothetical protein
VFRPSLCFPVTIGVIFQQITYVGYIADEGQFGDRSAFSWVSLRIPLPPILRRRALQYVAANLLNPPGCYISAGCQFVVMLGVVK